MARVKKTKEPTFEELSREEQIAYAINKYNNHRLSDGVVPPVPEHFDIQLGDEVIIGNLKECVVAGMSEDRRIIAVELRDAGETYGRPFDNGRKISNTAWAWYDVYPRKYVKETSFMNKSLGGRLLQMGGRRNSTLDSLLSSAVSRTFWINEKYQRGYVWNDDDKTRLIDSIFKGVNIGDFIFITNVDRHDWRYEVLDGQQRLTTLVDFIHGRFKYRGYYWNELSNADRNDFENLSVAWVELDGKFLTEQAKAEIFLLTNVAGVPQTEEHLQKVKDFLANQEVTESH